MNISLIVATDKNNCIGFKNSMPWHLAADLKFFKQQTLHKVIVMGYNTYLSIGRPLPNRTNIVLSKQHYATLQNNPALHCCADFFTLIDDLKNNYQDQEIMIIGGGTIYTKFLPYANKIYLTKVDLASDTCDTYFPSIDLQDSAKWSLLTQEFHEKDLTNDYAFTWEIYQKK